MERHGEETHVTTDEARGGETPSVVRYMLLGGIFLAAALMTIIWVSGAWSAGQPVNGTIDGKPTVSATK
ncbi:hypothetical protein RXV95_10145 [Novosphingobium sp. ZN18A2]|uniref:hypothetical protein n=1 Tax=Novosphingobium sp. ZN18A2 TaxID=3079861 RepID=UPI0030D0DC10